MLRLAIERGEPACIRYNRGRLMQAVSSTPVQPGIWEVIQPISDWTIVASGPMVEVALPVAKELGAGLINVRTLRPLDEELLDQLAEKKGKVLVAEESIAYLYPVLAARLQPLTVRGIHLPTEAIPQGGLKRQRAWYGLTAEKMKQIILEEA